MRKIIFPRLDAGMTKGVFIGWLKNNEEDVKEEEPIAIAESEKVSFEIRSPAKGRLYRIPIEEGTELPVGVVIAVLMEEGDELEEVKKAIEEAKRALSEAKVKKAEVMTVEEHVKPGVEKKPEEKVKIFPAARRLAKDYGIDLRIIRGTGPEGVITVEDVKKEIEKLAARPAVARVKKLIGIRKTSAERLAESFRTAPHASIQIEVDAEEIVKLRSSLERRGLKASFDAIFIKAVATALREFPEVNSYLEGDEIKIFRDVNICFAVDTEKGLLAPVLRNADKKSLEEIVNEVNDLVTKAKEGKLQFRDLTGGTFTITNLGMFGVDSFNPIINPPQAAILGIATIAMRPKVIEGKIEARRTVKLTLTFDHRIIDGALASKFLQRVKEILESQDSFNKLFK